MKKISILLTALLLISGCSSNTETTATNYASNDDSYDGPVTSTDSRTENEKILDMIQDCLEDYQDLENLQNAEEDLGTSIPRIPLGVTYVPMITSLNQVTVLNNSSNTQYACRIDLNDNFYMKILIYEITGNSFWLSGGVQFCIDPANVEVDNPAYTEYKEALNTLLPMQADVLNWLYGVDVTYDSSVTVENVFHPVISMGTYTPSTIEEVKNIALSVYTEDFLNQTYFPAAFEGNSPIYKEIDGILYVAETDLSVHSESTSYASSYIVNAVEYDNVVTINVLTEALGDIQSTIYTISLQRTDDGNSFRLPEAY